MKVDSYGTVLKINRELFTLLHCMERAIYLKNDGNNITLNIFE